MREKLKECPFCGGAAECETFNDIHLWVECTCCGARTRTKHGEEVDAIEAWNRRIGE